MNDIINNFSKDFSLLYPEIIGVGCNNEQSYNGVIVQKANITVDLEHTDNIVALPFTYMGISVIYITPEGIIGN